MGKVDPELVAVRAQRPRKPPASIAETQLDDRAAPDCVGAVDDRGVEPRRRAARDEQRRRGRRRCYRPGPPPELPQTATSLRTSMPPARMVLPALRCC